MELVNYPFLLYATFVRVELGDFGLFRRCFDGLDRLDLWDFQALSQSMNIFRLSGL